HTADEEVVLPVRKLVTSIKSHSRDRDRGNPENHRWFHALLPRPFADARPQIEATVAHHRPTIVSAGLENIHLVSAVRAILVFPDLPCYGIQREAERVSMPHCVNLRPMSCAPDEWIVGRNGSVVAQPEHLTREIIGILRTWRLWRIADADAHIDHSV